MKNKTISIPDELFNMLKSESNASDLIVQLCNQHYNSIKPKELLIVDTDVFDTMDKGTKLINKEQANNRLRDAVLEEIDKQEREEQEEELSKEILTEHEKFRREHTNESNDEKISNS